MAGIESGANKYVHPASHAASVIQQDATHRFVTDTEKTKWNGNTITYSKASKGYVVLGGICIQWGTLSVSGNSKGSTSFARSFGGTPYSGVCSWDYDYTGGQENYGLTSLTSTTIYITNGEGSTRLFRWIVIGPA